MTMKKIIIASLLTIALMSITNAKHSFNAYGNFGFFYSSLSSHGEWIDCDLGYVWRPLHVSHGWRPYLHGRWIWTDYGWYWVSYEPFGWATFHYGRWQYDDYYGWIWIPDDVWGPAWVEWRYDNDYIGWSPLPPQAVFRVNIGISFGNHWIAPIHYWNFVSCYNFTHSKIADYVQPIEKARRVFGNTMGIRNISYDGNRIVNHGVDINIIEQKNNIRINKIEVIQGNQSNADRIVRNSNHELLEVFRPRLDNLQRGLSDRPAEARKAERPINIERMRPSDNTKSEELNARTYERRDNSSQQRREMQSRTDEMRKQRQYQRQAEQQSRDQYRKNIERRYDDQRKQILDMRQERMNNQRQEEFRQRESQRSNSSKYERRNDNPREQSRQEDRSRERKPRR
jgi:hypothetical protein